MLNMFDNDGQMLSVPSIRAIKTNVINKYIIDSDTVLELGAGYGAISCAINKKLSDKTKQVVVEPCYRQWKALENNKTVNECEFSIIKGFISRNPLNLTRTGNSQSDFDGVFVDDPDSKIDAHTLEDIESEYNLKFNVLVADCGGFMERFFGENPTFCDQLRLIILEEDCKNRCDYQKIRINLHRHGFRHLDDYCDINVWIKDNSPPPKLISNMKGFIINLERNKTRREVSEQFLDKIDIDMEFFKGVDGQFVESDDFYYHSDFFYKYPTRPHGSKIVKQVELNGKIESTTIGFRNSNRLSVGAIGCVLSHIMLYNQLVNDPHNEAYLILEDDNKCLDIDYFNKQLKNLPANFDYCPFSGSMNRALTTTVEINEYYAYGHQQGFNRTNCYVITKSGARKFLDFNNPIIYGIDDALSEMCTRKGLKLLIPRIKPWVILGYPSDLEGAVATSSRVIKLQIEDNPLGVSMFQYAYTKARSLKENFVCKIDKPFPTEFDSFHRIYQKHYGEYDRRDITYKQLQGTEKGMDPSLTNLPLEHHEVSGYFFDYNYFDSIRDILLNDFQVNTNTRSKVVTLLEDYNRGERPIICVNMKLETDNYTRPAYVLIKKSIDKVMSTVHNPIIFGLTDDVILCKELYGAHIGDCDIHYINKPDMVNLCLMQISDAVVVSGNMCSWWGAYTNKKPDKQVAIISPMINNPEWNEDGLYYPGWEKISL